MTTIFYTLDTFIDAIREELSSRMNDSAIEKQNVCKANDLILHGITARKHGSDAAPTVYVDEYHNQHMSGRALDSIVTEMISIFENADAENICKSARDVTNFESIRDKLTIRLLDKEKNHEYLKTHPFREIGGGLAITADISFCNDYLVAVTNDMAKAFDTDNMFETAVSNMMNLHPAKLTSMEDALFGESSENVLTNGTLHIDGMNVLTGEDTNAFGASVLAYPMVTEQIHALYGMDYFILPSSLHEVLTVPDNGAFNAEDLANMVRQANAEVVEAYDVLSDGVYHYSHNGLSRVA